MKRWRSALLLLATLAGGATHAGLNHARAQGYESGEGWSVEWVLPGCQSIIRDDMTGWRAGVCFGIVMAVIDMKSASPFAIQNTAVPLSVRQRLARDSVCPPRSATDVDGIRIVVAHAQRGQANGTLPNPRSHIFSALAYNALQAAWPCEIPTN